MPASTKQSGSSQKAGKRHQPYKKQQSKARPKSASSSTSSSLPTSRLSSTIAWTPRETLRDLCLEVVRKRFPEFTPLNDYEIFSLSDGHYKGSSDPTEIRKFLDAELVLYAPTPLTQERLFQYCTDTLNMKADCTGVKPRPGDPGVFVRPIPQSKYSIRLFPGSIAASEYCLDFVLTSTGEPVNSPFPFQLFSGPGANTPMGTAPAVQLSPLECAFGMSRQQIPAGSEKFLLRDGQKCILRRPNHKDVRFTVPIRQRPEEAQPDEADFLELPQYITI